MAYTEDIVDWILMKQADKINSCDTAFSKEFGFIRMKDGRKAQVKVILELDEDEWD